MTFIEDLARDAAACCECDLHRTRTRSVFCRGNIASDILFVGEAPGGDEDACGVAFIGAAGQKLDRMMRMMGLRDGEFYIANAVKCRPPKNRPPTGSEIQACSPFLHLQIREMQPRVIIALGRTACSALGLELGADWRGSWQETIIHGKTYPVMPTYHPSYLLRQEHKAHSYPAVGKDLGEVVKFLGRSVTKE